MLLQEIETEWNGQRRPGHHPPSSCIFPLHALCVAKSQTAKRRWPPEEFGSGGSGTQATQDGSLRRRSLHL